MIMQRAGGPSRRFTSDGGDAAVHLSNSRHRLREEWGLYASAHACQAVKDGYASLVVARIASFAVISVLTSGTFDRGLMRLFGVRHLACNNEFAAIFAPVRSGRDEPIVLVEDAREALEFVKGGRWFAVISMDGVRFTMCAVCCRALLSSPWFEECPDRPEGEWS